MSLEEGLKKILLGKFSQSYAIILYGSVVYGKERPSDIDVMIISNCYTRYYPFKIGKIPVNVFLLNKDEMGNTYFPLFIFPYKILYVKESFESKLEFFVKRSIYATGSHYFRGLNEEGGRYKIRKKKFLEIIQVLESIASGYLNYNIKSVVLPEYTLEILPSVLYYDEFKCNIIGRSFKICFGNTDRKVRSLIELSEKDPVKMFKLTIYNTLRFFSAVCSVSRRKIRRDRDLLIRALYFVKYRI